MVAANQVYFYHRAEFFCFSLNIEFVFPPEVTIIYTTTVYHLNRLKW